MLIFTPDGLAADFFGTLAPYMPPPPRRALPPLLWGRKEHVRELFDHRVSAVQMTRGSYVECAESPHEYVEHFMQTFGPAVAIRASLAGPAPACRQLRAGLPKFAKRANGMPRGGPAEYRYDDLLVVVRKRDGEKPRTPTKGSVGGSPAEHD